MPAVDGQVPHAAHELPVPHREVFRQVGDAPQEQRPSQVQGPVEATSTAEMAGWRGAPWRCNTVTVASAAGSLVTLLLLSRFSRVRFYATP